MSTVSNYPWFLQNKMISWNKAMLLLFYFINMRSLTTKAINMIYIQQSQNVCKVHQFC